MISVITVVKNDSQNIQKTLQSVHSQTYKNFEHIVIDGKSTDGTYKIIQSFKNKKISSLSSSDLNMYDAINKGICKAKGQIICLLHSGDVFYNQNILKNVSNFFPKFDCIAGNIIYSNSKGQIVRTWISSSKYFNLKNFYEIPHTSLFIKKKALLQIGTYLTKYDISSDMDFIIRLVKTKKIFFIKKFLVNMSVGGLSTNKKYLIKKIVQDLRILFSHFGLLFFFVYLKKISFKLKLLLLDVR